MSTRPRPRPSVLFAILVLLAAAPVPLAGARAQAPEVRGPLAEVRVEGTDDYADIVRTLISAREGTPAERIDLEAERNRVFGLGTFETVSVDLLDEDVGPVLRIRVAENPEIGEVAFQGVSSVGADRLRSVLAREHLLEAGRIYNVGRADEATQTIADVYRAEGFPFRPPVVLDTEPAPELAERGEDPPVRLVYQVDESAPLDEVRFGSSEVFDEDELRRIFARVADQDAFDLSIYRNAVSDVGERYEELGYRRSGVDLEASSLRNGVLEVRLRELRIASIDTTPLGIDASELSVETGDLFDYDALLADVRRLAEGQSGDVRLVPAVTSSGMVRVTFELGPPDTAGEIREVRIEGNTVLSDEELTESLTLREGDTFTSTLADEDFGRIAEAYAGAGYAIASEPSYNWLDGVYVQRVTEYRVGAYDLNWTGDRPAAEPFVVLRELPEPGSVLSLDELDGGLRRLLRQGAVRPVDRRILPSEAGPDDEVLVEVTLESAQTGLFQPSANYSTISGFSASLSVSEQNLWGRAHAAEASVDARTSDIGFLLGGNVRYRVPWVYLDALDFRNVRTSVTLSLYSNIDTNQPLSRDGTTRLAYPGSAGGEANEVSIGEYARRETGVSVSAGRPLTDTLDLQTSLRASLSNATFEPPKATCRLDDDGNVENPGSCAFPEEDARDYLPIGGASTFLGADLDYDTRDSAEFPREGLAARASVGVGIGNDFSVDGERTAYHYEPVQFGVKSYVTLASLFPEEIQDENHVFAGRLDVGHQFGGAYPAAKRFRLGGTVREATRVRGYRDGDFDLSRTYGTASLEYRYDFGLSTVATQTLIGIGFVDAAWASGMPGFAEYGTPIVASAGVGLQVNLGFSGVALPALRFDYGFSETNPTGVFAFRVGTVF